MNKIFFTSDTHFCHDKDFVWQKRGFSSVQDMNAALVCRWNEVVDEDDTVFHLGDLALGDVEEAMTYIRQLKGQIIWIGGNHDTENKIQRITRHNLNINFVGYAYIMKYHKLHFYLSHYPTITANFDDKYFSQHVINLHGHTHQVDHFMTVENPFMYNVGVDACNNTPIEIDKVIDDISCRWRALQEE